MRTQKLGKHYAETPKIRGLRNQGNIMQRHKKYEDTKIRETLYTGTKNTRTQKLRKNYAETPKIQGLRNQGNIMQRHHKYEDTEIRESLKRHQK